MSILSLIKNNLRAISLKFLPNMNQKILFEINKFTIRNKKSNHAKKLPASVFFTDRAKINNLDLTIKSLPKKSAIIIREYDLDQINREIFARKIISLARGLGLTVLVGKDIALAKKIKADGVHFSDFDKLPYKFFNKKTFDKKFIFSLACHNLKSVIKSQKLKPDIIFIAPIFLTKSHLNAKTIGLKNLAKISLKTKNINYLKTAVYALGGINESNILSIRKLNLAGFAAISLFLRT